MGNLRKWSQTATGNATIAGGASTINWAEGQLPSTVNNSARETLAQIRQQYTPSQWLWVECSATASVASQTTFKLTGDQTGDYSAGRRWRLKSGSSTRYGSIVSSSYTTETTVTVTVDSGSLSASHTLAAVSGIDTNHISANTYVTSASLSSALTTALAPYATSNSVSIGLALKQNAILIQDEGVAQSATGAATTFNFVGAGISVSVASGVATITSVPTGGMTLIQTLTTTGTSTLSVTGISSTYRELFIELENVSSTFGTYTIRLAVSANNGSSYGGTVSISSSTTVAVSGCVRVSGIQLSTLSTTYGIGVQPFTSGGGDFTTAAMAKPATTGPINAIQFSVSGGNFSTVTIRVYGVS